jgi:hypothetical protein
MSILLNNPFAMSDKEVVAQPDSDSSYKTLEVEFLFGIISILGVILFLYMILFNII